MQTSGEEIAYLAKLVCFGNAAVGGNQRASFASGLWTRFVLVGKRSADGSLPTREFARDPDEWYAKILARRTVSLRLHHRFSGDPGVDETVVDSFASDGGRWRIEADLSDGSSDIWFPRWESERETTDALELGLIANVPAVPSLRVRLPTAFQELAAALHFIRDFAERKRLDEHADLFARTFDALHGKRNPVPVREVAPVGSVPEAAIDILRAVQLGWVFTGRRPWNDVRLDDQDVPEYERLTERYCRRLVAAVEAAANSSANMPTETL
ncbi:MAG TPA: hypothetical protein VGN57_17570 [Pirellulaceae bacterium]|jgi:hypothetical protein|nr:hypothetical protein [Pirellulaceae bacterium]